MLSWHIPLAEPRIVTPVTGIAVTVIDKLFEATTGFSTQAALLVIIQLTTSVLLNPDVVYVTPPAPTEAALTIH
jgi:hypothetical protein